MSAPLKASAVFTGKLTTYTIDEYTRPKAAGNGFCSVTMPFNSALLVLKYLRFFAHAIALFALLLDAQSIGMVSAQNRPAVTAYAL